VDGCEDGAKNEMLTVGVDIVEIARIEGVTQRWGERFLERVYTPSELAYCRGRTEHLAARFAAKEAVSKALGTGIGNITWREIEVLPDEGGQPRVYLQGSARHRADRLGLTSLAISLSHSGEYAIAFVSALVSPDRRT